MPLPANRDEYLDSLIFCFMAETAGAMMGEVAMMMRPHSAERSKLDLFRRIELTNAALCERALVAEGVDPPAVDPGFYRGGIELGLKVGEGDWGTSLDNFEATIHPELFTQYYPDGADQSRGYDGLDADLLRHLVDHELAFIEFVAHERMGRGSDAVATLQAILDRPIVAAVASAADSSCFGRLR